MQAHTVRHVEKFANFMSPVGLSISSQYNNSNPHKRQRFNHLTNPPNVHSTTTTTGHFLPSGNGSGSDSEHGQSPLRAQQPSATMAVKMKAPSSATSKNSRSVAVTVNARRLQPSHHAHAHTEELKQSQWHRAQTVALSESLRHSRNRGLYFESTQSGSVDRQAMDAVLDKLVLYGYETSADIAKMQPWQLRVLKREIPCIDYVFMTAYRLWGKPQFYDDHQNLAHRQFWDPAVWLQYNEIELVVQCFDASQRSYRCMVCGTRHGLHSMDELRWHIWLDHKDDAQLTAVMQQSKKHHTFSSTRSISPNIREKSQPQPQRAQTQQRQVISLLDDTDDDDEIEMHSVETIEPKKLKAKFTNKGRPYLSRRENKGRTVSVSAETQSSPSRKRRSRRLLNRESDADADTRPIEIERAVADAAKRTRNSVKTVQTVQHPIIVNGAEEVRDEDAVQCLEVHGSASPAFMPSADMNDMDDMNGLSMQRQSVGPYATASTFSLDTEATMSTMEMEMDIGVGVAGIAGDELNFPDDDGFSVMGFHDDFRELGMMSMLSRNSSNSFNEGLNLNSSFCKMDQSDSMDMI